MSDVNELEKSWYTKYRPTTMEEYSGPAIKNIVSKRFKKKSDMPHVIMIHGNRGCGKTSFARIISKYYLCTNPHEDGTPCEECEACQAINEILISGESTQVECPGVTELDATTMNGKDAIQEVLDDAIEVPIYTKFKVLIIDEVHMVTNAAQNSMLKVIEDIPPHLVVIFATTNPEKVLQTIKSRCQLTLEARKQSVSDMANRLLTISKLEKLHTSKQALEVIARKGNRVPRECINILENIAKTYDGEVTLDNVKEALGGITSELYMGYFKAANESLTSILLFVNNLKKNDVKASDFVEGLMGFVLDSMYIKHGIALEDYPADYVKSVKELFNTYTSNDFDILLQILEDLNRGITTEESSRNEVLLTTAAMRISKLDLLANGLAEEQQNAVAENKISLYEHSKKLKADNAEVAEQLKTEVNINSIKDDFEGLRQVANTAGIIELGQLQNINIPVDEGEKEEEKVTSIGSEVDDFFSDN